MSRRRSRCPIDAGRPGIVDWEYACTGDPAYDLAIVTRGGRKPLGLSDGRGRLPAAYRKTGGVPLVPNDVAA